MSLRIDSVASLAAEQLATKVTDAGSAPTAARAPAAGTEPSSATSATGQASKAGGPPKKDKTKEIRDAADAFEAILLRQMLASAKVAGKGSYSDMGTEALAGAVSKAGGLGLGRAIEQAIGQSHHAVTHQDRVGKK